MTASPFPISLVGSTMIDALGRKRPVSPTEPNGTSAVSRAQTGDHDAFAELYGQHKKRVFFICMRIVRDFDLAEDLTQETFLQVHRKLASFRGDSLFTTWLHRLAVNTVLMHLRKRALSVISLDHLMSSVDEEHAGRSFGKRDLTQTGAVDRLAINRAVATLTPGYRNIFLLHDVQGFDHVEVASMLNCSYGSTKSQLHRARRALRGALTPHIGSGLRESVDRTKDLFLVPAPAVTPRRSKGSSAAPPLRA